MDWEIRPRSEVCSATKKAFAEDEEFYTLLFDTPEGYVREDLCMDAWQQRGSEPAPLSFWKSTFQPAPPAEAEAVTKDDAESELRRLMENRQSGDAKLCHLLALLLERKRVLKARERIDGPDGRIIIYEHSDTQESFLVPEVDFKLADLDALREEMNSGVSHIFSVASKASALTPAAAPAESE